MLTKLRQYMMEYFTVCPKTGKITGFKKVKGKTPWLWIVIGLASVIWVIIRVVPKPSRAAYPCQQVAQPLAAGFIAWLLGLIGSALIMQRTRHLLHQKQYMMGAVFFTAALLFSSVTFMSDTRADTSDALFVPTDPANTPVGIAKGINPGRVVWVYSSKLLDQESTSGWYWDDERTDPVEAENMVIQSILNLTGETDPVAAWDALFKNFNQTRYNETDLGYQAGDKIAIKINNVNSGSYSWDRNRDNLPSPQMMHALISQLVNKGGVPQEDITFYDCIKYHGDPLYNYCHAAFPGVRWVEGDATDRWPDGPGHDGGTRETVERDPDCVVHFGDPALVHGSGEVCLPTVVSEAKYVMTVALPRAHVLAGYTGCAKNFFGSVWQPDIEYTDGYYHLWSPKAMHPAIAALDFPAQNITMREMGTYNALVDLMGHKDLGGKTVLSLVQCLRYKYWSAEPFNGGFTSSLFMSQDMVAMESVMIDFLRSEGDLPAGTLDNFLHEAAQANDPPSGTVYDPENDGTHLESLGVHEHWNNSTDKQYSRNLGSGNGIELIQVVNQTLTGVESRNADVPAAFNLGQNFPNPFNPSTTIGYSLATSANVRLNIYNLQGEKVRTLINRKQSAGSYEISWDGRDDTDVRVASGMYIYRMQIHAGSDIESQSQRMLLLK